MLDLNFKLSPRLKIQNNLQFKVERTMNTKLRCDLGSPQKESKRARVQVHLLNIKKGKLFNNLNML